MASALAQRTSPYAALLRRPGYRSFVLTVLLSRLTVTMFNTTGVLLVLARTGSPAVAGATAAAASLPGALSGPLLGAWLDVARRRRVLIVIDNGLSIAGLLGMVALAGHAPDWTLPAVGVLYSVTRPLTAGSFFSALAEIAGRDLLDAASKIEASSLNLAFVIGPALGGTLAGAAGPITAVEVQAGITLLATVLIAVNPAFEVRPRERAASARAALRDGVRAVRHSSVLRTTALASVLAAFGWGLMAIGFPLYALRTLHVAAHNSGYMWAAMALGSTAGTFLIGGAPALPRIARSYLILGFSALLWPLVHTLALGVALIGLTGFLEGPAYSGTITLRQRLTPPAVRAQVMTTLSGANMVAVSIGAAAAGAVSRPGSLIVAFTVINLLAALAVAARPGRKRAPT